MNLWKCAVFGLTSRVCYTQEYISSVRYCSATEGISLLVFVQIKISLTQKICNLKLENNGKISLITQASVYLFTAGREADEQRRLTNCIPVWMYLKQDTVMKDMQNTNAKMQNLRAKYCTISEREIGKPLPLLLFRNVKDLNPNPWNL